MVMQHIGDPNFIILYVKNAGTSAAFYSELLGRKPAQLSPTFATFPLASGLTLGLWTRDDVQPRAAGIGDRGEICFPVADAAAVKATHEYWAERGVPLTQPVELDFGPTFVALDPDGHRLRVFAPAQQAVTRDAA